MSPASPRTVRRIRTDEGPTLRTLRLAALASDPLAFGSTYEREAVHPEEHWVNRAESAASGGTDAIFLLSESDRPPHGMVGAFLDKGGHYLWGMWVEPGRRGERAGDALLTAILAWCEANPTGEPIRLDVTPNQVAAIRMYERHGFRWTGQEHPLGHHGTWMVRQMALEERAATPRRGP